MKIILFANTDWYIYNFRLPLVERLVKEGHKVVIVSPSGEYSDRMVEAGYDWQQLDLSRKGMNPIREIRSIIQLVKILKREEPDVIHNFTIKCMLYGSLAAKISGVPGIINAVTGLGYMFSKRNLFTTLAFPVIHILYKFLFHGTYVIFQNSHDMKYLVDRKLVSEENHALIPGSGVDTLRFIPNPEVIEHGLVILPGRMLWDKGVGEFVSAARMLKLKNPGFRFALVGSADPGNPSSISVEQLQNWAKEGVVEWWGWQEDMISVYQRAEIVCLPSYHEGLSKSLIEAASCGCPLIASDIPGCREVVHHGVNGMAVPKGDVEALADAIQMMINDDEKLAVMRKNSRRIAVDEYALEKIISKTIIVYNQLSI